MSCRGILAFLILTLVVLITPFSSSWADGYTLYGLGTLGGEYSRANAVNSHGDVVGYSVNGNGQTEAFLWTGSGGMVGLGWLPGDIGSEALGINGSDQVVGYSYDDHYRHAFIWTQNGGMVPLGDLPGGFDSSEATGINNSGQVVGYGNTDRGNEAFLWTSGGGMVSLGFLPGSNAYGWVSVALGINNAGEVVGSNNEATGHEAFLWTATDGMKGLGDLNGGPFESTANAINDAGQIVGFGYTSATDRQAFLCTPSGQMTALGALPGSPYLYSEARGINSRGQVVGYSQSQWGESAFLWTAEGGMLSLTGLAPSSTAWFFFEAVGINDNGDIAGTGWNLGRQEAFLLKAARTSIPPEQTAAYSDLVDGVSQLCSPSAMVGPITCLDGQSAAIISGDANTYVEYSHTGLPVSPVAGYARFYGSGRVVALGHEWFVGLDLYQYDNARFADNVMRWLDAAGSKRVLFRRTGWSFTVENALAARIISQGYDVTFLDNGTELSPSALEDRGVLIYCTRWDPITPNEIQTIDDFVGKSGGGVLLTGLGWSYMQYVTPDLDYFPMNQIGARFGLRFEDGVILDPYFNDDGDPFKPIFHVLNVPDTDGDGLADVLEIGLGTNLNDPDTDHDGLLDGAEVYSYRTSPLSVDSDNDGLKDGEEVADYFTNPACADTDGDGLNDGDEIKIYGTDPRVADTDGDGLNDGEEVLTYKSDPKVVDTDGDGLSDGEEVQVYGTSPTAVDTDGDGLRDGDEVHTYGTDPADEDTDSDTFLDGAEIVLGTDPKIASSHPQAVIGTDQFDVSAAMNITKGGTRFDRRTGLLTVIVTVSNPTNSILPVLTPLSAIVENIAPSGISVAISDGTTNSGSPYIHVENAVLADGKLAPGESLRLEIVFRNPTLKRFTFDVHLAGKLIRATN